MGRDLLRRDDGRRRNDPTFPDRRVFPVYSLTVSLEPWQEVFCGIMPKEFPGFRFHAAFNAANLSSEQLLKLNSTTVPPGLFAVVVLTIGQLPQLQGGEVSVCLIEFRFIDQVHQLALLGIFKEIL